MKPLKPAGLALALCFFLSACGTITARLDPMDARIEADYYKGTTGNLYLLGLTEQSRRHHYAGTIFCVFTFVCPFLVVASAPVDLAIDTVLLPVDLYQNHMKSRRDAREAAEPAHAHE